jgi:hypothetical protein
MIFPKISIRNRESSWRSGYRGMYLQTYMKFSLLILHEIFFVDFLIVFAEWLHRLAKKNGTFFTFVLRTWTPELIQ